MTNTTATNTTVTNDTATDTTTTDATATDATAADAKLTDATMTNASATDTTVTNVTVQSQLQSRAVTLSRLVTRNVFNIPELYPAQIDVLTRLVLIKFKASPYKPSSIIFVHPNGGGKSLVQDVHVTLFRRVSLTIVPVLSLGANLSLKVRQRASHGCGGVVSIHIDEIQNIVDAKGIINSIEALPLDTKKTSCFLPLLKSWWTRFIGNNF